MNEAYENGRDEFMRDSEWTPAYDGLKRTPMNGAVIEIVNCGNGFYQTVVDQDAMSRIGHRYFPAEKCKDLKEAKQRAWSCFEPLLKKVMESEEKEPPANLNIF